MSGIGDRRDRDRQSSRTSRDQGMSLPSISSPTPGLGTIPERQRQTDALTSFLASARSAVHRPSSIIPHPSSLIIHPSEFSSSPSLSCCIRRVQGFVWWAWLKSSIVPAGSTGSGFGSTRGSRNSTPPVHLHLLSRFLPLSLSLLLPPPKAPTSVSSFIVVFLR